MPSAFLRAFEEDCLALNFGGGAPSRTERRGRPAKEVTGLPQRFKAALEDGKATEPETFPRVTCVFTDIVGFSQISSRVCARGAEGHPPCGPGGGPGVRDARAARGVLCQERRARRLERVGAAVGSGSAALLPRCARGDKPQARCEARKAVSI